MAAINAGHRGGRHLLTPDQHTLTLGRSGPIRVLPSVRAGVTYGESRLEVPMGDDAAVQAVIKMRLITGDYAHQMVATRKVAADYLSMIGTLQSGTVEEW